ESRFYDPATGQFLSPDDASEIARGGVSPYSYAFNNPLTWVDPDGRQEWSFNSNGGGANVSINLNWPTFSGPAPSVGNFFSSASMPAFSFGPGPGFNLGVGRSGPVALPPVSSS